jgi:hypothetical protein
MPISKRYWKGISALHRFNVMKCARAAWAEHLFICPGANQTFVLCNITTWLLKLYMIYYICQVEGMRPERKGCPREQVSRSQWSHRKELRHFAVYKCEPEPLDGMEYGEYGGWMTRQSNRWTNVHLCPGAHWTPGAVVIKQILFLKKGLTIQFAYDIIITVMRRPQLPSKQKGVVWRRGHVTIRSGYDTTSRGRTATVFGQNP